ncbi:PQQ-dependent sugar dehydrogenase [Brevibacillus humidisoli]|uniref:PQQ-dependent sugar dehydrogenase n=1 Tax=Brevibacillus humidisoli TaxID=2895522 RepID=UPI001E2F2B72|nr:PQQ-dependent sugar dehydrogenase [Brevibacillus humidisoli]UFJ41216.1 PQQ-dependent sugar dehydrogenase [Brevibacillus humidisoli]
MKWLHVLAGGLLLMQTGCDLPWQLGVGGDKPSSAEIPYQEEIVAGRLHVPWELVAAPDGRLFFTERPGTIRVIQDGRVLEEALISFPAPFLSEGEGGLLGLALDPDFADNHYMYAYHSYRQGDEVKNRVIRLKEAGNKVQVDHVLLDDIPGNLFHNGGRIKIGPDGYLYITTGDAQVPDLAQDPSSLAGKILRIALDGEIPRDNPFPGSPVYSLGHRNPQGLAWHPQTGELYSSEHGQSAHDELNRIVPGANYGWPLIEGAGRARQLQAPLVQSGTETWAPSGMTFVTQGEWQGRLLLANLRGQQVLAVDVEDMTVQPILHGRYGRIRTVFEAADGSLYLLTNNHDGRGRPAGDDDRIIRLRPPTSK